MVFYFTGTGNSLYVAKQLEAKPISIPQVMKKGNSEFSTDSIGIVAPVYGHEIPPMVKEFLKKSSFPYKLLLYDFDLWKSSRRSRRTGKTIVRKLRHNGKLHKCDFNGR